MELDLFTDPTKLIREAVHISSMHTESNTTEKVTPPAKPRALQAARMAN
jgi:hypothetical protein